MTQPKRSREQVFWTVILCAFVLLMFVVVPLGTILWQALAMATAGD